MIKKYVIISVSLMVIILCVTSSSALLFTSNMKLYEKFPENSVFNKIFEPFSQIKSDAINWISTSTDGKNGLRIDTIDADGSEGTTLFNESTVVENGDVGTTNEITVEKDGETGNTLERVINIIIEHNEQFGARLQRVVERTFAYGTTMSDGVAENIVQTVVVGGSGGTAENNKADVIVVTSTNQ